MKERIITGAILVALTLLAILYLPLTSFSGVLIIVGLIGISEWRNMLGLTGTQGSLYLAVSSLVLIGVMSLFFFDLYDLRVTLQPLAFIWLLMPFLMVLHSRRPIGFLTSKVFLIPFSVISLLGFVLSLTYLKESGAGHLIAVIFLVAIADSGAYFVGRKFGRTKLAPSISPGKTVEGALGGMVLALIYAAIVLMSASYGGMDLANGLLLTVIVVAVSISGDLFESVVKRHRGIKDSGKLLPGHGGILDRIDALTAAAPVVISGMLLMGL